MSRTRTQFSEEALVLTKATIQAAEHLGLSQKTLAPILGLSESAVSRMRRGTFVLPRGAGKAFELAELFVRMFLLLDRLVEGDEDSARAWLTSENAIVGNRPIDAIRTAQGLVNVVNYLGCRLRT
jgi:DNA-directed RNA polymerase specialized sigma24 family protein